MARLAHARDDPERAAVLLGAADNLRAGIAVARPRAEAAAHYRFCEDLDRSLGAERAAQARANGATLSLDEAVAVALGGGTAAEAPAEASARGSPTPAGRLRSVETG